jgi:DNA-binding transcriptional ArsR family regulator
MVEWWARANRCACSDVWLLHSGELVGVVEEMSTLNGAILRVLSDGKHYTIKNLYHAILDNATLYEGTIPKSTLWYHLLKLQKEGKVKSVSHDGSNRVEYYSVGSTGTEFQEDHIR